MRKYLLSFISYLLVFSAAAQPRTFLWNGEKLAAVKAAPQEYREPIEALIRKADRALELNDPSVMDKRHTPVSGSKHDYMSLSRYFWPDPSKPDGLPYISRDGESNPELEQYDRNRLGAMTGAVADLSLAYYLSGQRKYADKALSLLRTWFIDPATRMNPNMNYAQIVPGEYGGMGRSFGIIDGYGLVAMLDGVQLLGGAMPGKDLAKLKKWFARYSEWLVASDHGRRESAAANNHSVAYDVQLLMYSLFGGETEIANKVMSEFTQRRVDRQIAADGSQPHELERTIAYWYSVYNLAHILDVCDLAAGQGVTLYDDRVDAAVRFLIPYIGKSDEWPWPQIHDWAGAERLMVQCLYRAAKYRPEYTSIYRRVAGAGFDGAFVLVN